MYMFIHDRHNIVEYHRRIKLTRIELTLIMIIRKSNIYKYCVSDPSEQTTLILSNSQDINTLY